MEWYLRRSWRKAVTSRALNYSTSLTHQTDVKRQCSIESYMYV